MPDSPAVEAIAQLDTKVTALSRRQTTQHKQVAEAVAVLSDEVGTLSGTVEKVVGRMDAMNLNGSTPALKQLAAEAPALLEVARVMEGVTRWFHPVRVIGGVIGTAILWSLASRLIDQALPGAAAVLHGH